MPDEDKPIEPGSITQTADLMGDRVAEVSNVSKTINEMQREVNQRVEEVETKFGDVEAIEDVQNATVGILHKMSDAMGSFARGINSVTMGTAEATKDAISQYGKAIAEDISVNKQSVITMAMARSTPLFGYFAAKFMETDVFQKAKERMKTSIANVFSGVGKTIGGFFKGRKEAKEEVPKMQRGGYVEKGGLVEVHAGEVVAPIEKVLDKVDETIGVTQDLAKITRRAQLNTLAKMTTFVRSNEEMQKVGIFKGFMRAMRQVQTQYEEPSNIRMLRAVLSIQDQLGATIGTWPQVFQKMLVEHPTFRNMLFAMRGIGNVFIGYPMRIAYGVFKARGGYAGHLMQSRNPFEQLNYNIGLIYSEGMWRLDNIALFTRATAQATRDISTYLTGKKYPPLEGVPVGLWSIITMARRLFNLGVKWMPGVIGAAIAGPGGWKKGWSIGRSIGETLTKEPKISQWLETATDWAKSLTWAGKIEEGVYGRGGMVEAEGFVETAGVGPASPMMRILMNLSQGKGLEGVEPIPVKLISYDEDVMEAEYEEAEKSSQLLAGVNNLYAGWTKQHKVQKEQVKVQKKTAKSLKEMNAREKLKWLLSMALKPFKLIKQGVGFLISSVTGILSKAGLTSAAGLVKFLGPVAAVLAAGAIGYAIGSWINKYLGPWLNKKWDQMYAESRRAQEKETAKSWEASKKARVTEGVKGLGERYRTKLLATMRAAQVGQAVADDPKLGLIQQGQAQYYNENLHEYLRYPVDSLGPFRREWMQVWGAGGRFQVFGAGTDPIKYGRKREASFLRWLKRNKQPMTDEEIRAEAEKWTEKVRGAKKPPTITEKVEKVVAEKKELAEQKLKEGLAHAEKIADKVVETGKAGVEAGKKQAKELGATVVSTTSNVMNQTADNSKQITNAGMAKSTSLYNDLKQMVITGKHMDHPTMFD